MRSTTVDTRSEGRSSTPSCCCGALSRRRQPPSRLRLGLHQNRARRRKLHCSRKNHLRQRAHVDPKVDRVRPEAVVENVWPGPRLIGGDPDLTILLHPIDRLHPSRAGCDKDGHCEFLTVDLDDQRRILSHRPHQPASAGCGVVGERLTDFAGVPQRASVVGRQHCHTRALRGVAVPFDEVVEHRLVVVVLAQRTNSRALKHFLRYAGLFQRYDRFLPARPDVVEKEPRSAACRRLDELVAQPDVVRSAQPRATFHLAELLVRCHLRVPSHDQLDASARVHVREKARSPRAALAPRQDRRRQRLSRVRHVCPGHARQPHERVVLRHEPRHVVGASRQTQRFLRCAISQRLRARRCRRIAPAARHRRRRRIRRAAA